MRKIHSYELQQHFTYPEQKYVNYSDFVYFICIFAFLTVDLSCAHPIFFGMKVHCRLHNSFLFCFSSVAHHFVFSFFNFKFCLNIFLTTPNFLK